MTLIGASCDGWDGAVLWCDSETYVDRSPVDERCKLVTSTYGGVIAAGTGMVSVIAVAERAVHDALDLDDLGQALPAKLLQAAADATKRRGTRPGDLMGHAFIAAGFSRSIGRTMIMAFEPERLFEPRLTTRVTFPEVEMPLEAPRGDQGVIILARRQMVHIRERMPGAAGMLCVARVDREGIRSAPIYDFVNEVPIAPRPPSFPEILDDGGHAAVEDAPPVEVRPGAGGHPIQNWLEFPDGFHRRISWAVVGPWLAAHGDARRRTPGDELF